MENNDPSRLVATTEANEFTLTIDDAHALYTEAGITLKPRSIQRYCAQKKISSRQLDPENQSKYLITRASVEKHIAHIKEKRPPTSRDVTRPVATTVAPKNKDETPLEPAKTPDQSRRDATAPVEDTRYVAAIERENEFLRKEIDVKNSQIKQMGDRAQENNILMDTLQKILKPLLENPKERSGDTGDFSDQPR